MTATLLRIALIVFVIVPLAFLLPPLALYPYKGRLKPLAIVTLIILAGALVFFQISVLRGLVLYVVAGLISAISQSVFVLRHRPGEGPEEGGTQ